MIAHKTCTTRLLDEAFYFSLKMIRLLELFYMKYTGLLVCFTLRPSGTLLFSGHPMIISKKKKMCLSILKSNWKNSWNQSVKKVNSKDLTEIFCACFKKCLQNLLIYLEAKSMHGSSWNFFSIISVFILVFAGQVHFTVNGLL